MTTTSGPSPAARFTAGRPGSNLRIGDAERDAAIGALGDHYAAGRLTKDEFDQRSTQASTARYEDDLAPLFSDLPGGVSSGTSGVIGKSERSEPATRRRSPRLHPAMLALPFLWLAPVVLVAMIAVAIIASAPWVFFLLFWFCAFGGFGRRHHRHRQHGYTR